MTDTVRTISYLLGSEFQDGQAVGSITPQRMRDLIVTIKAITDPILTWSLQSASYTLALADAGMVVVQSSSSPTNLTIPPFSSVAFPTNTIVQVMQYGAGQVTLVAGAGVTLRTASSLTTRAQYSMVNLWNLSTNEWVVSGDLT